MNRLWMPFWVNDYVGGTRKFSTLEHGAYILLILEYWQHGRLPTEDDRLARIAGLSIDEWLAMRDVIAEKFILPEWRHTRIDAEIAKADRISKGATERVNRRWAKKRARNNISNSDTCSDTCLIRDSYSRDVVVSEDTTTTLLPRGNSVRRAPKRASPRTPIPENFEPDRDHARALGFPEVQIDRMVTAFRNHHTAKGSLMANWPAAWRTWCGNETQFRGVDRAKSDLQAARDELFDNIRRELTGSQSGSGHPDGRLQALKRPQS